VKDLVSKIEKLRNSEVGEAVRGRMEEFTRRKREGNEEWFSELCFCILTANATAEAGLRAQRKLGAKGFLSLPERQLADELRKIGHRFPNARARFIVEARRHWQVRDILNEFDDPAHARAWLVDNVKGVGLKEASHFLRNVGFFDFAILDRHVLGVLHQHGVISEKPRHLSKKKYEEIEKKVRELADKVRMKPGELDLYLWFMKTGKVLK
jgi:N-glycosylase/DNA lyase